MILGDNGILKQASKAKEETEQASQKELEFVNGKIKIDGKEYDSIEDYIKEQDNIKPGTKVNKDTIYVSDGKIAVIPEGFTLSGIESEIEIDNGLVIYLIDDKTNDEISNIDWTDETVVEELKEMYDQFVWIPVQDINDMFMCQSEGTDTDGNGIVDDDEYSSCKIVVENGVAKCTNEEHSIEVISEDGSKLNKNTLVAGRLYATEDEDFNINTTTQTYNANSGNREPAIITGTKEGKWNAVDGDTENLQVLDDILGTNYVSKENESTGLGRATFQYDLQSEYNQIAVSVYENKGFYISRYETSYNDVEDVQTVSNVVPCNNNWYELYAKQKIYTSNKSLKVNSSMILGSAYDQVMCFLQDENYFDVTADIDSNYTTVTYTGQRDDDKLKNLYDIIGNAYCWTTEAHDVGSRCERNGYVTGSTVCVSRRSSTSPTTELVMPVNGTSSRIMLYIPVNSSNENTFPFDWENESSNIPPYVIPVLDPINENLVVTGGSFRTSKVNNGKFATLTVKCSGVDTPSLKVFDEDGNEVTMTKLTGTGDSTEYKFTAIWKVSGYTSGKLLYYVAYVVDSDGACSSNYEVFTITVQ